MMAVARASCDCIAPEEIGGVQVVVGPERRERGKERRKFGMKGREEVEGLCGADANGRMASQRRASAEIARHGRDGIACGKDGEAGDQRAGLAGRSGEIARGKMETRERLPGGMRVGNGAKRRPGDGFFVEIDARGNFVHLVDRVAEFDRGFSRSGSKDARDRRSVGQQMREKAVLLEQAFAIAHGLMMALDEDFGFICSDNAGRGKRARAHGENALWSPKRGKLAEQRAHFVQRERRPVGRDQRAVHAVGFCGCAHRSNSSSWHFS